MLISVVLGTYFVLDMCYKCKLNVLSQVGTSGSFNLCLVKQIFDVENMAMMTVTGNNFKTMMTVTAS